MRTYTAVVEKCPDTGLYVGYVPGFSGAHSQAETMDELAVNLKEVLEIGDASMDFFRGRPVPIATFGG